MSVKNLTDIKLVSLIRDGKDEYEVELYRRYKQRATKLASAYYYANVDNGIPFDEYYSRAFAAIGTVIQKYDVNRCQSIYAYWKKVATNDILRLISQESYFDGAQGFYGVSLDASNPNCDDGLTLGERISLAEPNNQYSGLIDSLISIVSDPKNGFTEREQQVLTLHLDGEDQEEIMRVLNIKTSTMYAHLKNGYEKLRKILLEKKDI